ncbi:hypothetical protein [Nocardia fusca]|uniref:Uncharacterized protein n=1 Tax=Nocardia fusca TaxID=941183 RepID=A0ABV3FJY0_9NOCA
MPDSLQPATSPGPDPADGAQLKDALRAANRAEPSNFERLVHLGRSDTMAIFTAALIEAKGRSNLIDTSEIIGHGDESATAPSSERDRP